MATDTATELWGEETRKAIANFPVSGQPIPVSVVRWLGRIKSAAARANAELGLLDPEIAERIAAAGDAIAAGEHDDQFPIDVFQTGLRHLVAHERQRGDREPRGRGGPPERPREHGPVVQRRLPVGRPPGRAGRGDPRPVARDGRARLGPGAQVGGVRRGGQGRAHASDGRRSRHPRPGVRRLRRSDQAGHREGARHPGARRPDPARRHRHRHRPQHALGVRPAGARQARRGHGA